jgi:DNA-binding beta-propeller fold protein YncE
LAAQVIPAPTQLPGQPFFIKKTWVVGGVGNWGYLTMDPSARRLYIAHGAQVQIVDVETGALAGTINGLREAQEVVLDRSAGYGYISDGLANQVKVFDRESLEVVAAIPTGPNPRALVLDPQTGLLFAICAGPSTAGGTRAPAVRSILTVIDAQARKALANIVFAGRFGFAQDDGAGHLYVVVTDRNQIARIDATAIPDLVHRASTEPAGKAVRPGQPLTIDWSNQPHLPGASPGKLDSFPLGVECGEPRALAVDPKNQRIFAACDYLKMEVINADTGDAVATLPTGRGADSIGYDPDRGLIYSANGGGDGNLTIIRRDSTDTYAVIQNLPTHPNARTLAIDEASGEVYLVTILTAAAVDQPPANGIGNLKMKPADASFQVMVIGQ